MSVCESVLQPVLWFPRVSHLSAAHNYASHFGGLSELSEGDSVAFTDMNGITTVYQVVAQDVLSPYAVEEICSGEFDLTLFTCTYGGKNRVTVYCNRVS